MWTRDQYDEFALSMETKFPKMFDRPYGGFAINAGWWKIIESLCSNIQSYTDWKNEQHTKCGSGVPISQVKVNQIKEKFGGLRFYYEGGDDQIHGMVRMAEAWADASCETCGNPGTRRSGGWIRTLCDAHEAEYQSQRRNGESG
jgi:hypothetical protein